MEAKDQPSTGAVPGGRSSRECTSPPRPMGSLANVRSLSMKAPPTSVARMHEQRESYAPVARVRGTPRVSLAGSKCGLPMPCILPLPPPSARPEASRRSGAMGLNAALPMAAMGMPPNLSVGAASSENTASSASCEPGVAREVVHGCASAGSRTLAASRTRREYSSPRRGSGGPRYSAPRNAGRRQRTHVRRATSACARVQPVRVCATHAGTP